MFWLTREKEAAKCGGWHVYCPHVEWINVFEGLEDAEMRF